MKIVLFKIFQSIPSSVSGAVVSAARIQFKTNQSFEKLHPPEIILCPLGAKRNKNLFD